MKRFNKIYLEISNLCNLSCSFCPGTRRQPKVLTEPELAQLLPKLQPWTDYLYFHLMGEPLLHPKLERFLEMAADAGFKVILTTNGTLLPKQQEMLLRCSGLYKLNISLHAFEANDCTISFEDYLHGCLSFGKAAEGKKLISYRLWNQGGQDEKNGRILEELHSYFPGDWVQERKGIRIGQRIYLEHGDKFDWPELSAEERQKSVFCYGLLDQIGILADGTVVPCCLDHDGDIRLGNLFEQELEEILSSPKACAMLQDKASEELCRKCGYAQRFHK